ncbi:MAG: HAD family phosphatase [Patescibacteria group bacterium]
MKAVIFDMDGVVSDTQKYQAEAESKLLLRSGIHMSPDEITAKYAGVSDYEWFKDMFAQAGQPVDLKKIVREKWKIVFEIATGRIQPIKGATALIKNLKEKGFPLAIASASAKPFINLVMKELSLENVFDVLVSSTEVAKGKPAPDIFLLAAEKLGVAPLDCVVIEDGIKGMEAAKTPA